MCWRFGVLKKKSVHLPSMNTDRGFIGCHVFARDVKGEKKKGQNFFWSLLIFFPTVLYWTGPMGVPVVAIEPEWKKSVYSSLTNLPVTFVLPSFFFPFVRSCSFSISVYCLKCLKCHVFYFLLIFFSWIKPILLVWNSKTFLVFVLLYAVAVVEEWFRYCISFVSKNKAKTVTSRVNCHGNGVRAYRSVLYTFGASQYLAFCFGMLLFF